MLLKTAVVDGAYLASKLGGRPVCGRIPVDMRPVNWSNRFWDPVVKLDKALYGLPRAGFDWYDHFEHILKELEFESIQGWDSVYKKGEVTLIAYVDDLVVTGPKKKVRDVWAGIRKKIDLRKPGPTAINEFLNVEYAIEWLDTYKRKVSISQHNYCKLIIDRFKESEGLKNLTGVSTPAVNPPEVEACSLEEDAHREVWDPPEGLYSKRCRMHIGGLLWLARCSRPDITFAVTAVAKQTAKWTVESARALRRIYQYLEHGKSTQGRSSMIPLHL